MLELQNPGNFKDCQLTVPCSLATGELLLHTERVLTNLYLKTRPYLNSTLCQILKAFGEKDSEIVSGSSVFSPDIDVLYIYINTRVLGCNVVAKFQSNR
jgi:hypothetical protein